jgi:hypothetical protein
MPNSHFELAEFSEITVRTVVVKPKLKGYEPPAICKATMAAIFFQKYQPEKIE